MSAMTARQRYSTATPGPSGQPRATGAAVMPVYEQPTFALNPDAQRQIAQLLRKNDSLRLNDEVLKAQDELTTTGAALHDKLREHEDRLEKRQRKQTEATQSDEFSAFEQQVKEMREKVEAMTGRMEKEMRGLIDCSVSVKAMSAAVETAEADAKANASTQASTQPRTQRRRRRGNNDDEDEDEDGEEEDEEIPWDPTDPAGATQRAPKDVFDKHVQNAQIRHQGNSLYERYAENEAYATWKQLIHDAQTGGEEASGYGPLADPTEWFAEAGAPPPGTQRQTAAAEESDDDIIIERSKISIKCPLSLQEFKEPLSSNKCKHSFEASAILEYINGSTMRPKAVQCPVPGCPQVLAKTDLRTDKLFIRKVRAIQKANRLREERGDDSDSDAEPGTQRRGYVIDDDDDEDATNIDNMSEEEPQSAKPRVKPEPKATGATGTPQATQPPGGTQVIDLGESGDEDDDGSPEMMEE